MCIICVQFQKNKDWQETLEMIIKAGTEPNSIDKDHLIKIERAFVYKDSEGMQNEGK